MPMGMLECNVQRQRQALVSGFCYENGSLISQQRMKSQHLRLAVLVQQEHAAIALPCLKLEAIVKVLHVVVCTETANNGLLPRYCANWNPTVPPKQLWAVTASLLQQGLLPCTPSVHASHLCIPVIAVVALAQLFICMTQPHERTHWVSGRSAKSTKEDLPWLFLLRTMYL